MSSLVRSRLSRSRCWTTTIRWSIQTLSSAMSSNIHKAWTWESHLSPFSKRKESHPCFAWRHKTWWMKWALAAGAKASRVSLSRVMGKTPRRGRSLRANPHRLSSNSKHQLSCSSYPSLITQSTEEAKQSKTSPPLESLRVASPSSRILRNAKLKGTEERRNKQSQLRSRLRKR